MALWQRAGVFGLAAALLGAAPATAAPCEGSAPAERATAWRAQVETDPLVRFAGEVFGPPTACRVDIEPEREANGPRYGTLVVSFTGGATYTVASAPPEASRMSLRSDRGLPEPAKARAALVEQARRIGLQIDWGRAVHEGDTIVYHDPTPGMNAAARLRHEAGTLVEAAIQLAP